MHDSLDWKSDDRAPWVTNSLRARIDDLRAASRRCRGMFSKGYMGEPANYLADAYAEAADLLEAKLRSIRALENGPAVLADAHTNPPLCDLSSLRKGAEVEKARQAVERLANVQMNISLEEWGELSSAILSALVSGSREEQA